MNFTFLTPLVNLLDNANKYSPETQKLESLPEMNLDFTSLPISDKGMGMEQHNRTKIFKNFSGEETGNIHNVKGQGLGLSYVKKIVELHNGQVIVESEKDKGDTFTIKLPMK